MLKVLSHEIQDILLQLEVLNTTPIRVESIQKLDPTS